MIKIKNTTQLQKNVKMDKNFMIVEQNIMKTTEKEVYLSKNLKKVTILVTQQ